MTDPVIEAAKRSLARTTPGANHANHPDDGLPGSQHVRIRSIPHISTGRLWRRAVHLYRVLHTPEGMHEFDDPRRTLIHHGMHLKAIVHELDMRGSNEPD